MYVHHSVCCRCDDSPLLLSSFIFSFLNVYNAHSILYLSSHWREAAAASSSSRRSPFNLIASPRQVFFCLFFFFMAIPFLSFLHTTRRVYSIYLAVVVFFFFYKNLVYIAIATRVYTHAARSRGSGPNRITHVPNSGGEKKKV